MYLGIDLRDFERQGFAGRRRAAHSRRGERSADGREAAASLVRAIAGVVEGSCLASRRGLARIGGARRVLGRPWHRPLGADAWRDAAGRRKARPPAGHLVERRPQWRRVRRAREARASIARHHGQPRHAGVPGTQAPLGGTARARRLRANGPRSLAQGLAEARALRRAGDRPVRRSGYALARRGRARRWSEDMLAATSLPLRSMPRVVGVARTRPGRCGARSRKSGGCRRVR